MEAEVIWFKQPDLKDGETVQLACPANHTQNQWRAVGGKLFITTQRVIFFPNIVEDKLGGNSIEFARKSITDVFIKKSSLLRILPFMLMLVFTPIWYRRSVLHGYELMLFIILGASFFLLTLIRLFIQGDFKECFNGGLVDRLGIRLNNGQEFLFVVSHVQETMTAIDAVA